MEKKLNKHLDPSFKNRITHLQVYICIAKKKKKRQGGKAPKGYQTFLSLSDSVTKKGIIFFFILLFYNKWIHDFITVRPISLYTYSLSTKSSVNKSCLASPPS